MGQKRVGCGNDSSRVDKKVVAEKLAAYGL